ncbi:UDP-N-acetylenolpyruvoylglucosamine reductase [Anaerotignum neopropionicum]|uniref:UDP-N-acetylenolpyruvoylglucosamine reductase n=1 Tax=Anaerotignum neopropionicum TaxID=36847 RepID=A0A136WFG8_9FIRM|nr:UDP-N-acetylmuramate dehydrogenase [Anaerotignum neopropionicum]KXL53298.1 UDP-N-acetylenolpyruvoylglucosamine reductase [Anaerotignum neopropionicum]
MDSVVAALRVRLGEDAVLADEPMDGHTTFRTGGPADIFIMPGSFKEVKESISILKENNIPFMVIGNGSNLLVRDKGIRGAVIQLGRRLSKVDVDGEFVFAEGGALLTALSAKAAENALSGLEFASGIPGTVGGAITMNAGAYGGEMKDVLISVEVLTEEMEVKTIPVEALELSYRHSILLKDGYILLRAKLKLKNGNPEEIKTKMAELGEQRREKQPLQYPSAGSTFKRPQGYFAGKLIQDAGLKGKRIGGAQISEKHAGFIINVGKATTQDILDLIAFCQQTVYEKFGVRLETEVKIIGEL